MLSQELQLMSRMSRVTSYDQSRLTKQDLLPDTNWHNPGVPVTD